MYGKLPLVARKNSRGTIALPSRETVAVFSRCTGASLRESVFLFSWGKSDLIVVDFSYTNFFLPNQQFLSEFLLSFVKLKSSLNLN